MVKTLHTMNAYLMVDPAQLAGADHTVFVSGDDAEAKATVTELLRSMGWTDIIERLVGRGCSPCRCCVVPPVLVELVHAEGHECEAYEPPAQVPGIRADGPPAASEQVA